MATVHIVLNGRSVEAVVVGAQWRGAVELGADVDASTDHMHLGLAARGAIEGALSRAEHAAALDEAEVDRILEIAAGLGWVELGRLVSGGAFTVG